MRAVGGVPDVLGPDRPCVFPVIHYVLEMKREYFSVEIVIVQNA